MLDFNERQSRIMQELYKRGKVLVTELKTFLNVSPATIRRDIEELVANQLAKRIHGGIVLPDSGELDPPVFMRRYFQTEEKQKIARETAKQIKTGETIFLGNGSSVLEVAENLKEKKKLTVITNALPIYEFLVKAPNIKLILTGGGLKKPELSLIGQIVENSLKELRADKVVMSFQGIHPEHGLTNNSVGEANTDRAIFNFSSKVIIVADHTKCNAVRASSVADIDKAIDKGKQIVLITDNNVPEESVGEFNNFVEQLSEKGVKVIIAED